MQNLFINGLKIFYFYVLIYTPKVKRNNAKDVKKYKHTEKERCMP